MDRNQTKLAIEQALDHVHTDIEALIKQNAAEHALVNMGQEVSDFASYCRNDPSTLLYSAYRNFYQQSESDEMADGTEREFKSWLKIARKDVAKVQKKGLPLTARNVRAAFLSEGPFAKKAR